MTNLCGRSVGLGGTTTLVALLVLGCGDDDGEGPASGATERASAMESASAMGGTAGGAARSGELPDDLPMGLLVAYSPFGQNDAGQWVEPRPARLELLTRRGGEWQVDVITDDDSNVFHKAMVFEPPGQAPGILTIGGMGAFVKLWRRGAGGWEATTLWTEDFGGARNRMRDVEIGDLYGDGRPALAIATHDQGVFATIRVKEDGGYEVTQSDKKPNTFVHEVEIGDLDGDGTLEVYATPSEPNTMNGQPQSGQVVRYVPSRGMEPAVVADLGNRHAKEILVDDVDGDGRDELYVSVEGLTRREGGRLEVIEPVEIRRYDADTPPDQGVVIARIEGDHLMRFLTAGDVDGDGKKEIVAASFSKGLWLLRPGANPRAEWSIESIDRDSGGFEHASVLADLDGDGTDELYVASDNDGEIRRYVWVNGRARRSVIHSRSEPRSMITWNLMPAPAALLRGE